MWRYSVRNEATLAMAAEHPAKNIYRNIFGVILEASQPALLDDSGNYCVHLKIADQTFNFAEKIEHAGVKFHKFAHVYIYTNTAEDAPQVIRVGDLLRLYYARFYLSGKGELVCRTDYFCDWRVYPGDKPLTKPSYANRTLRKVTEELTQDEENHGRFLQGWGRAFLGNNIMKDMTWWHSFKRSEDGKAKVPAVQTGVDLIVRLVSHTAKSGEAEFIDKYGNKFSMKLSQGTWKKDGYFKVGEINVKMVSDKDRRYAIQPSKYLIINALPADCKDVKNFGKKFAEIQEERKAQFLQKGRGKALKETGKAKTDRSRKPRAMSVSEALKLLKNPEGSVGATFALEAGVEAIFPKTAAEITKKMILQNKSVHPLESQALRNLDAAVIFQFVLTLTGEKGSGNLPVYVNTAEDLSNPFAAWELLPDVRNVEGWQALKQNQVAKWEQKMEAAIQGASAAEFTVRLCLTKTGKAFFQVLDTTLWN